MQPKSKQTDRQNELCAHSNVNYIRNEIVMSKGTHSSAELVDKSDGIFLLKQKMNRGKQSMEWNGMECNELNLT